MSTAQFSVSEQCVMLFCCSAIIEEELAMAAAAEHATFIGANPFLEVCDSSIAMSVDVFALWRQEFEQKNRSLAL